MTIRQVLPLATAPLVDPNTGIITREWLQVFGSLITRTGGATGAVGTLDQVSATIASALLVDPVDAPTVTIMTDALALLADPPDDASSGPVGPAGLPGAIGPPGASLDALAAILLADVPDGFF